MRVEFRIESHKPGHGWGDRYNPAFENLGIEVRCLFTCSFIVIRFRLLLSPQDVADLENTDSEMISKLRSEMEKCEGAKEFHINQIIKDIRAMQAAAEKVGKGFLVTRNRI